MTLEPYLTLVRYKQWADSGLHKVVAAHFDRLDEEDADIVLRVLDHIVVVDRIFQHHLQAQRSPFPAPRSDTMPDLDRLIATAREVDAWYVRHIVGLTAEQLDAPVRFQFANGSPGTMTRGEIFLHVCLHGTYHRGNAGILLQKRGIAINDDRMAAHRRGWEARAR